MQFSFTFAPSGSVTKSHGSGMPVRLELPVSICSEIQSIMDKSVKIVWIRTVYKVNVL
jgi:hypothetical protein